MLEHIPSTCETLASIPSTTQRNKNRLKNKVGQVVTRAREARCRPSWAPVCQWPCKDRAPLVVPARPLLASRRSILFFLEPKGTSK